MWNAISEKPVPKDGKHYPVCRWEENTWYEEGSKWRWFPMAGTAFWSESAQDYIVIGGFQNISKWSHWCEPPLR